MDIKPVLSTLPLRGERRPVSVLNAERAVTNIQRKLKIMESWIETSIPLLRNVDGLVLLDASGQVRLDFFPKTLRQFNLWESATNCVLVSQEMPEIHRNANDTLRKHESLRRSVELLIRELRLKADQQRMLGRPQRIEKLKGNLLVAEGRQARLEVELVQHRSALKEREREIQLLKVRIHEVSEESHRALSRLKDEVEELNMERAQLLRKLQNVVALKRVGSKKNE